MPPVEVTAFSEGHLGEAAQLLAARHERHRAGESTLPAEVDFRAQIESEWRVDGASGVVALENGRVVGYLLARPVGEQMIVGIGGHAVEGDAELVRDLYAAAAGAWVEAGRKLHAAFVPAGDGELVDAWFRLAFGCAATLAARETAVEEPFDAGVLIRPGAPADVEQSWRLDRELSESLVPAPSFSSVRTQTDQEYVDDWRDTWDDARFVHFVAERDGNVVGQTLLYRRPHDLRVPKDSIDLANAATFPELRGSGVGRALAAHAITWAYEHGFPTMITDWRMTNMLASRFWPRRGFRRTFLRVERNLP